MNHDTSAFQNNTIDSNPISAPIPLILSVDDDEAIRLLMAAVLEGGGFLVETAANGWEGVDAFQRLNPDIILMDVNMPEMDGFEACSTIRSLKGGKHTPILMMTGLGDVKSIDRACQAGATDFISKPINWSVLNDRLKYMIRQQK